MGEVTTDTLEASAPNGFAAVRYLGTSEIAVDVQPGPRETNSVLAPAPVRTAPVPQTRRQVQAMRRAAQEAKTRRIAWHILGWAMAAALGVVCFVLFHVPGMLAYVLNVAALVALVALVIVLWPRRRTGRSVDVPRGPVPEVAPDPATAPEPWVPAVAASVVDHAPSAATANTAAARAVRVQLQRRRSAARRRGAFRHIRQALPWALAAALVAVWFVAFRPQALGGSTEYVGVSGISMTPTMRSGDVAVVEKQASYRLGDIVVYHVPAGQPDAGLTVVHRIVGGNGTTGLVTKGDHNLVVDPWHPKTVDVVGRVWFHIPGALRWVVVAVVGVAVFLLAISALPRRRTKQRTVAVPKGSTSTPERSRRVPGVGAPDPGRVRVASPDAVSLPEVAPVPATAQERAEPLLTSAAVEPAPAPVTAPEAVPVAVVGEPVAVATPDAAIEPAAVPVPAEEPEPEPPVVAARIVEPPTASPWVADPTVPADGTADPAVPATSWAAGAPPVTTSAVTPVVEPVPAPNTTEDASPSGSYGDRTPGGWERPDPKKNRHHRGRRRRLPQP